jgi:hypothetical protein
LRVIVVSADLAPAGRRESIGLAVARACAAAGGTVQLVGIVPDDPDGDARILELSRSGVGHAAVLRAPVRPLEAADIELALRYLADVRVVVAAGLEPAVLPAAAAGAGYAGASLVIIGAGGGAHEPATEGLPASAVWLQAPSSDPDGTFAGFVGAFTARLDVGEAPADAWNATVRTLAVDPVGPEISPGGRPGRGAPPGAAR